MQEGAAMSSDDHRTTDSSASHVHETRRRPVKHVLVTVTVIVVLGALFAAGVLFSGLFNVAATVADAAHLANGFNVYRADCVMCHTPVGRQPSPMALGFNPQAPSFEENDMTVAQLFWAAKNGIRFTGMPAWGPSRSDQDLWDVVGFVMTLPKMSAADYDALDHRTPAERVMKAEGSDLGNGAGQGPVASSASQSTRPQLPRAESP
jgi:mono/diheme cytochrome c family protein